MTQEPEQQSFGKMLRFFRGQTIDRGSGRPLSQERLADKISDIVGLRITRNTVNNWETGKTYLNSHRDRRILTALVSILHKHQGIRTLAEANQLLATGGFSTLNPAEAVVIDPQWVGSVDNVSGKPEQTSGRLPSPAGVPAERSPSSAVPVSLPTTSETRPNTRRQPGNSLVNLMVQVFFAILDRIPDWLLDRVHRRQKQEPMKEVTLIDPDCGSQGIDLKQQRLRISAAFGSYFTGLLEKKHGYFHMQGQIDLPVPTVSSNLEAFQQIYWSMEHSRGPEVVLIAAEGGMGKSTLAAKIIRCLYSNRAVDLLLGDSAKLQVVNPLTGEVLQQRAEYDDLDSFLHKVSSQLGLEYFPGESNQQQAIRKIKDRIEARRAVLVMDNLETVHSGAQLLDTFRMLAGRDTRILVTTRSISGITHQTPGVFLILLNPIQKENTAREFLQWHIQTNIESHRDLYKLLPDLEDNENVRRLIGKTGGIPLLMQLILSDIARSAWSRLERLPSLFGKELLNFLYRERWTELGEIGKHGQEARDLLFHIGRQSHRGQVSYENLLQWGQTARGLASIDEPLKLLQERFLVVNSDIKHGNFSLFPSLADFLEAQQASDST